jgi:hypothetical protein
MAVCNPLNGELEAWKMKYFLTILLFPNLPNFPSFRSHLLDLNVIFENHTD